MASAAQLAALKKAREARAKNLAKKKPAKKTLKATAGKKAKKKVVRKTTTKSKTTNTRYCVRVTLKDGKVGYVTPAGKLDTELAYAAKKSEKACETLAHSFFKAYKRYLQSVEVVTVKKPKAGYGQNPVPASKLLKQKEAAFLYEDFTGHEADHYTTHKLNVPDVGLQFGKCTGIMYETIRDGKHEYYCHEFKKSARPIIGASHDGKQLLLVGGNYRFTNRGIVDN